MFEIAKIIMMTLSMMGQPTENIATINTDNPYVGTWEWEQTVISGRGGKSTANPASAGITRKVTITKNGKVIIKEDGKITCEGNFIISKRDGDEEAQEGELNDRVEEGCLKGLFRIKEGKLEHYQYLGCPSSLSTYTRVGS
jgi:hypothetical protein